MKDRMWGTQGITAFLRTLETATGFCGEGPLGLCGHFRKRTRSQ